MASGVLDGMQESIKILSGATKDTVKETVEHKFGEDAGNFVGDGVEAGINIFTLGTTKLNAKCIGKGALKEGGKEIGKVFDQKKLLEE